MTLEELKKENAMLRRKLSPLEDPEFTKVLATKMAIVDLTPLKRVFRKKEYVVVTPAGMARICGLPEDLHTLTNIGRSLQAMCWERSALQGRLIFVMPLQEYKDGLQ